MQQTITERLCTDLDGQERCFTSFTDTIEAFVNKKNLSKAAKSDEISEAPLDLKHINTSHMTQHQTSSLKLQSACHYLIRT